MFLMMLSDAILRFEDASDLLFLHTGSQWDNEAQRRDSYFTLNFICLCFDVFLVLVSCCACLGSCAVAIGAPEYERGKSLGRFLSSVIMVMAGVSGLTMDIGFHKALHEDDPEKANAGLETCMVGLWLGYVGPCVLLFCLCFGICSSICCGCFGSEPRK